MRGDAQERFDGVGEFAAAKFELVKQGKANRLDRILERIGEFGSFYNDVVPGLFVNAPTYQKATDVVLPRVKELVPSG